jgi:hypothetical protein
LIRAVMVAVLPQATSRSTSSSLRASMSLAVNPMRAKRAR